jgi:methylase of polypeptide subunit release factors
VEFREGFLLDPLADTPVDAIVSNPPYLTAAAVEQLPAEVRETEPVELALDGGRDGLGLTWRLLLRAHPLLKPGGLLAVQVDRRRVDRALELARSAGWASARVEKGADHVRRYVLAVR